MPIRFFSDTGVRLRKSRRKPPATAGQRAALAKRMESVFEASFAGGLQRLEAATPLDKLERLFRRKKYDEMTEVVPWGDATEYLQKAVDNLGTTINGSAKLESAALPKDFSRQIRLDTQNEKLNEYLNVRTGAMIENVKDNVQVAVQQAVQGYFKQGLTPEDVAQQVKSSIGLNSVQAQQLQNFVGTRKQKAELKERLTLQRARTVARTEISFAANQGQLAVWQSMQDQGLVSDSSTKVWVVDGQPCPKICDPMDGVEVPISEDFELPDGVTVPCPPAHPNCRCLLALNIGDNPTSGRENYKGPEEDSTNEEDDEP